MPSGIRLANTGVAFNALFFYKRPGAARKSIRRYLDISNERKSRDLIAAGLINKTATRIAQAVIAAYRRIPKRLRVTLTLDNGKEFARFKDIEKATGLMIYFADPYSAWQRGTNENTNGLLRRYSRKAPTLETSPTNDLLPWPESSIIDRKCLGYRTPYEVFQDAKCGGLGM